MHRHCDSLEATDQVFRQTNKTDIYQHVSLMLSLSLLLLLPLLPRSCYKIAQQNQLIGAVAVMCRGVAECMGIILRFIAAATQAQALQFSFHTWLA
jgi:hypothetical protein